jgi:hypothetical protein
VTAVMIEISHRPIEDEETDETPETDVIEIISDLDKVVEHTMCSCSASDDNPY